MPLDGLTLNLIKSELASICGCRIEKIHQPSKEELVFSLRSREGSFKLLLSASSNSPRAHLTTRTPENPATPPMLCMLLRKHLNGAVITGVRQNGLDRTLFIDLNASNDLGDAVSFTVCVEIMSKHSNIILVGSDGLIVDAVKRVDFTQSSVRQILPGMRYDLPPAQDKINILENEISSVVERIKEQGQKLLSQAVIECVEGVSPLISREIATFVCGADEAVSNLNDAMLLRLEKKLNEIKKTLLEASGTPTLLIRDGVKQIDFTFMDITQYGFSVVGREYESFSELLDSFYCEKDRAERTRQRSASMQKMLANQIARISRKIDVQSAELKASADRDTLRVKAELILANEYRLGKGALFYEVENYYNNNELLRIPADPALSPTANAQKYFKEYRKAKTAETLLVDLIKQGEQELNYLESVVDCVNRASGYVELAEIRAELYDSGYLKREKNSVDKKQKPLPPLEYFSDDGFRILVGRNNVQNDLLTFKTARKDDSWFHVQKMPGSHVVVLGEGEVIPERTARQAAMLAAYHSSARESSRVAVDYTEVRELKKPVGAKPGKVIYHTYNTMWAKPSQEECERLEKIKMPQAR